MIQNRTKALDCNVVPFCKSRFIGVVWDKFEKEKIKIYQIPKLICCLINNNN